MIKYSFVVAVMATILSACNSSTTLELKNEMAQARKDAPVVLTRAEIKKLVGDIPADKVLVVFNSQGNSIPCQVDDLDQDGQWDELALVCDFTSKEVKKIEVNLVDADKAPKFTMRTNVRLGLGTKEKGYKGTDQAISPKGYVGLPLMYQAESISWENDIMGFRNYFDCRNAKDLFGKLVPEMVMDKLATKNSGSYHKLSEWGMDVLHVGPSLGSGGLAMFQNDSLYRLGSTDKFEFQVISRGPVRSIFDMKYEGWNVEGKLLSAVERVSIWAGKYWFQSDVTVQGIEKESELAVGIVTSRLKEKKPFAFTANKEYTAIATHDKQSMNDDYLGMGILLKSKEKVRLGDAPVLPESIIKGDRWNQPVGQTTFITQKILDNQSATHYFFTAWEKENKKWAQQESFENMMKIQAEELTSPIGISIR